MDWLWRDVRFGLRNLNKDRRFALLAILALALGIGATTVIFSIVDCVLIDPLPYTDAHRLVHFYIHDMKQSGPYGRTWYTAKEFVDYQTQNHVFSHVMHAGSMDVLYTLGNSTVQVRGALLDPTTPADLGIKPILGRELTESDGKQGAPPVFLMSERMWRGKFGGDPKVLGMKLTLNDVPRTLIGVMPRRFGLGGADIWIPITITPDLTNTVAGGSGNRPLFVLTFARLKPGVTMEQAAADINVIAHNEAKIYPDRYPKDFKVNVGIVSDRYTDSSVRTMIYILLAAVLMLLLIACSNVANLLLARATARERELAVRSALGASRGRLIRQMLSESFLLASAAAAIGCFLAYAGLQWVKASMPPDTVPAEVEIRLSAEALLGTLGITLLTTLLCGLVPALRAARADLHGRLMGTGRGVGESSGHGRLRAAIVATQVGLAIVLLVGAGLMMRTFFALEHVDLGLDPKNLLIARVVFPARQYTTSAQKALFFRQALPRLSALPGVLSASEALGTPVVWALSSEVTIPGTAHSEAWTSKVDSVSEDYFKTMGIPLIRGKALSAVDINSARQVAVINRKLAHDFFGGQDPIGRTIHFDVFDQIPAGPHNVYFEIVGVVGDARNQGLEDGVMPEAYIPYSTAPWFQMILVKTAIEPLSILPAIREKIWSVDSNVALADEDAGAFEKILHDEEMAAPEFGLTLLSIFAGIGLTLSAIGVFSVMAYTVSLQTRDIGIRMALGAQQGDILKMVLLEGLALIGGGVVAGVLASFGLTRLIASQIWGVSATDPLTFAAVVAAIIAVGLAACLLPARRATRVDPLVALRYE